MAKQLHKKFTDEAVKSLLDKYAETDLRHSALVTVF